MNDDGISNFYNEEKQKKIQGYNLAVYHAKNALFISAGVTLIGEVIAYSRYGQMPDFIDLLPFALMFCTFLGLALWTPKKPYTALRIGAGIYCVYILLNALPFIYKYGIEGLFKGLYSGCLYKIIILTLIAKASPKAKLMQEINEEADK
ncbi:MAG: hypothetical protein ABIQ31_12940 [Ferruginibacter sp.]